MKSKPTIPIDPQEWTVDDWRDLWNGIDQIRQSIAARHNPHIAPPIDNAFVDPGCEQFGREHGIPLEKPSGQ